MCGILGQLAFRSASAPVPRAETIARLATLMQRRGPDQAGLWSDERRCVLAFRRLSILDVTPAGDQPMLSGDRRHALVYNGELYNFLALRKDLEKEGVRFRSRSDTEVVLYALALWGDKALERFNGMFALALYDVHARRLLLARDHAGIKPLYYLHTSDGVVFASQYTQILAHPWAKSLANSPDSLALCLRLGRVPEPYALLERTHALAAGAWIEISIDNRMRSGRFFDLPVYREAGLHGEDADEAVHAAVQNAVRRQMASDVPLGAFLSGGVDSPLLTACLKNASTDTVKTFTIGTGGAPGDESVAAAAYADSLGVEHVVRQVTPAETLDLVDDVVAASGEPFSEYSMFPTLLVSELARQHVKVVLSGDGGDELFWGYIDRVVPVIQAADPVSYPGPAEAPSRMKKLFEAARRNPSSGFPTNLGEWYRRIHMHIPEQWLRRMFPDLPAWPSEYREFEHVGGAVSGTAQWVRWVEYTTYMKLILMKVDRASMYHSLEVRVPFLDREVIDTALRVDWRSCLDCDRRVGKIPLRNALGRYVPSQTQGKQGFTVPMGDWLRGVLRPMFEDMVLIRDELLGLPMDTKAVSEMFDQHLARKAPYEAALWTLLVFSLWETTHGSARAI